MGLQVRGNLLFNPHSIPCAWVRTLSARTRGSLGRSTAIGGGWPRAQAGQPHGAVPSAARGECICAPTSD